MNNSQKNEVVKALEQYVSVAGSQNKAAAKLDVNVSTISKVRKADPDNLISGDMWVRLAGLLNVDFGWVTAVTEDYKRIHNICMHAKDRGLSRLIVDEVGTGKTHSLKEFAKRNSNVYYIECDEYWTKKVFLKELMQAMGIVCDTGSIPEMVYSIISFLKKQPNALIIIDEFDKLKDGIINFYKTFFNKTNAGFVLAGTPYLRIRIDKGVRLNKMCFKEIFSRAGGNYLSLHGVTLNSVKAICIANGIDDEATIKEIYNRSNNDLRRVKDDVEMKLLRTLSN